MVRLDMNELKESIISERPFNNAGPFDHGVDVIEAAMYLISLDPDLSFFNKRIISLNGCELYEGNARLNKMLHLAQNMYIGRHGAKLFDADFYAYDNGGVVPEVQENYALLIGTTNKYICTLPENTKRFLRCVFTMLKDAPIEELISIDHEDPAWREKSGFYFKNDQKMDSLKFKDEYRDVYEAANFYLDKLEVM